MNSFDFLVDVEVSSIACDGSKLNVSWNEPAFSQVLEDVSVSYFVEVHYLRSSFQNSFKHHRIHDRILNDCKA